MVKKVIVFLLFLFSLLPLFQVQAGELKMAVSHWPPWTIVIKTDGKTEISGIDVDIVQALARSMNLSLQLVQCPWKRCLLMMEQGQVDIITSLQKKPERESYMHFLQKPYKSSIRRAFYVPKGLEQTVRSYEDLTGMRIGLEKGSIQFARFDQDSALTKHEIPKPLQALEMLAHNRLDTVVMTEMVGDYLITTSNLGDRIGKALFYHEADSLAYMAISKQSAFAAEMPTINQNFNTLRDNGVIEKIKAQYFAQYGIVRGPTP